MAYMDVKEAATLWELEERTVTRLARDGRISGAKKEGGTWRIPRDSKKPLDGRRKEANGSSASSDKTSLPKNAGVRVSRSFQAKYGKKPHDVAFTPYRVCPIGAHSDHNFGKITGFAIDKGIYIAYGPKMNGVVEISSLQFPKRAQWHVMSVPETRQGDWADFLRGATIALQKRYPLRIGLCAVIDGELPIGGLSSSAAVIITFLSCLARLNNLTLAPEEMIALSKEAENNYLGVNCGKLDQSCEVLCRENHMLFLDTKDDSYELIPNHKDLAPFAFMILFSGIERSLVNSKFNVRIEEARCAAYALKAFAGMEYDRLKDTNLRDIPREVYEQYKHKLPDSWRKRAEHWYTEFDRVCQGAEAWRQGDLKEYGRLSFESGRSSIENWETGSPELITLYNLMTECPGIYGGRFSGAGFKGCCMAIVDPEKIDEVSEYITKRYLEAFPHLAGKFSIHICHSANGVNLK